MFALVTIKVRDCICGANVYLKTLGEHDHLVLTKCLDFLFVLPAKCILCVEEMNRLYVWDIWNFHVG